MKQIITAFITGMILSGIFCFTVLNISRQATVEKAADNLDYLIMTNNNPGANWVRNQTYEEIKLMYSVYRNMQGRSLIEVVAEQICYGNKPQIPINETMLRELNDLSKKYQDS